MPAEPGGEASVAPAFLTRGFADGDGPAILDLFARCFPHATRTMDHFRWKYENDPFGAGHISLTFDAAGTLVGHYAAYLVPFQWGDRVLSVHQVGDTMTLPAVRHIGRGPTSILGRTVQDFYDRFCTQQVAFNYGFNAANIHKFSLRFLGIERVAPVAWRERDLSLDPIPKLSRWARKAKGYRLDLLRQAGSELDEFFERVRPGYQFLVRRDARYLQWRYLDCPDTAYFVITIRRWGRLVGWSVFRVQGKSLIWGDALFDPEVPAAVSVMLRHVVPGYPVNRVEGWFPQHPEWFNAVLHELDFETGKEPQDLSLGCIPFAMGDAVSKMRESLYYTMGDSDLF